MNVFSFMNNPGYVVPILHVTVIYYVSRLKGYEKTRGCIFDQLIGQYTLPVFDRRGETGRSAAW